MKVEDKVHIDLSPADIENIIHDHFESKNIRITKYSVDVGYVPRGEHDVQELKGIKCEGKRV
jgi:hypothetical protein